MLIPESGLLRCIGVEQDYTYFYVLEKKGETQFITGPFADPPTWECSVYLSAGCWEAKHGTIYDAVAKEGPDGRLIQFTMLLTHGKRGLHSKRGIPEAMVDLFHRASGLTVVSSSNENPLLPGESRSIDATGFWNRMVRNERAEFDQATDRYRYTP